LQNFTTQEFLLNEKFIPPTLPNVYIFAIRFLKHVIIITEHKFKPDLIKIQHEIYTVGGAIW